MLYLTIFFFGNYKNIKRKKHYFNLSSNTFFNNQTLTVDFAKQLCQNELLIGKYSTNFYSLIESYFQKIRSKKKQQIVIFLCETKPFKFLAAFLAAIISESSLFLVNSQWQEREYKQLFELVKPDLIFGDIKYNFSDQILTNQENIYINGIMIPTGGSSGKIKFAIHSWKTLINSVQGFYKYFNQQPINSFCVLPLYHVSGLMQFLRSFLTNGKLIITSYQDLKKGKFYSNNLDNFFISLVPTQLRYLLENNPQWLAQFQTVLVGGASTNNCLLDKARKHKINVALTYGMTETASGITILKPEDYLTGNNSNGQTLAHAQILIESPKNDSQKKKIGTVKIKAKSLFQGYYPNLFNNQKEFITDDFGYFDEEGYLYILGRNSQKIITGGENVYPSEIEETILATGLVKDVCVVGKKDEQWGEVVTAIFVPQKDDINSEKIKKNIKQKLSSYKIPKCWYKVDSIQRNAQGKININQLKMTFKNL